MLGIEESTFSLGLTGKLPSAGLITWFGQDYIDLKEQSDYGQGQSQIRRVSDREKEAEITAKATITQLKKEHLSRHHHLRGWSIKACWGLLS